MAYSDDLKEVIRDRCDIVEIIQRTVPLRRAGKNWTAPCPFHDEKDPSFTVSPERQRFHCFGCAAQGDVFKWIMQRDGVDFPEALSLLAEEVGVDLRRPGEARRDEETSKARLREALEFAARRFTQMLQTPRGGGARRYLEEREIHSESRAGFELGYSPDQPDGLLRPALQAGFTLRSLEGAGLVKRSSSGRAVDLFQGRLMIPIRDPLGRLVGFGGRLLPLEHVEGAAPASAEEGEPAPQRGGKYINSPETTLFKKSNLVFALDRVPRDGEGLPLGEDAARSGRWIALVEGYTDVIAAHQHGIPWVVAALGTALTDEHARLLKRQQFDGVLLVFDGDRAGVEATLRSIPRLLKEELRIRVLNLPEGRDPADFLAAEGPAAFLELARRSGDWVEFLGSQMALRFGEMGGEKQGEAADWMLGFLAGMDPLERERTFTRIADHLKVPEEYVRHRFRARAEGGAGMLEHPSRSPESESASGGWRADRSRSAGARRGRPGGRGSRGGAKNLWRRERFAESAPPSAGTYRDVGMPVGALADCRHFRELIGILADIPSLCPLVERDWPLERFTGILGDRAAQEVGVLAALLELRSERGGFQQLDLMDKVEDCSWLPAALAGAEQLNLEQAKGRLAEILRHFERRLLDQRIRRDRAGLDLAIESRDEQAVNKHLKKLHEKLQVRKGVAHAGSAGEACPEEDSSAPLRSRSELRGCEPREG